MRVESGRGAIHNLRLTQRPAIAGGTVMCRRVPRRNAREKRWTSRRKRPGSREQRGSHARRARPRPRAATPRPAATRDARRSCARCTVASSARVMRRPRSPMSPRPRGCTPVTCCTTSTARRRSWSTTSRTSRTRSSRAWSRCARRRPSGRSRHWPTFSSPARASRRPRSASCSSASVWPSTTACCARRRRSSTGSARSTCANSSSSRRAAACRARVTARRSPTRC